MSRPQVLKRLVTISVLASLCSALFVSTNMNVRAANPMPAEDVNSTKISPDLRQLLLSGHGDARVKVIVQSVPSASDGLLGNLLNTVGGLLVNVLSNLNIRIVDIEANNAALLAGDPSVAYVSLDNNLAVAKDTSGPPGAFQLRLEG